jgi:predicted nucleic acid-binding protein
MGNLLVLDTGPAGEITHPQENLEIAKWMRERLVDGDTIVLPEVVDFELRRSYLLELAQGRKKTQKSLDRLNELKETLTFLPINSEVMLKAAELWAGARHAGRSTADNKELDCDVILAAQVLQIGGAVVTSNPGHLGLFVPIINWRRE